MRIIMKERPRRRINVVFNYSIFGKEKLRVLVREGGIIRETAWVY
jgi:hypothetical protein